MKVQLGRLERFDLRTAWEHEERDFTSWLAAEDNLSLLGEVLGLELECMRTEQDVGSFRADILCRDTVVGSLVVIENQLEQTDHTHLGQLLTYAAGLGAATVVWVASKFRDEHRAALDWLNQNTGENLNFFGMEIELWRIEESPLAPKFNLVSKPNDWVKTRGGTMQGNGRLPISDKQRLWLDYWTQFMELVRERNGVLKARKPKNQSWVPLAIGTSGFAVGGFAPASQTSISACLLIGGSNARYAYKTLLSDRIAIEKALGESLNWVPPEGRRGGFASIIREDVNWTDRDQWPNQHEWLLEKLEKLHEVFAPRLKTLPRVK